MYSPPSATALMAAITVNWLANRTVQRMIDITLLLTISDHIVATGLVALRILIPNDTR